MHPRGSSAYRRWLQGKDRCLKVGKVWSPARTRPHGKGSAYNRKTGSRREGSRLAAEAVRAMTARTTQPRLSKGPLGERGRCLQERLGVVPLAAITRRGAVPVWLRASWSGPLAAAKAASQPANCWRHEGWSRSPSPCTRWGTRLLICARFPPDWGKPNVRLIGGWEETGPSRLCRAARGASRLPDRPLPQAGGEGQAQRARACGGRAVDVKTGAAGKGGEGDAALPATSTSGGAWTDPAQIRSGGCVAVLVRFDHVRGEAPTKGDLCLPA